jgi:hypothetical protein
VAGTVSSLPPTRASRRQPCRGLAGLLLVLPHALPPEPPIKSGPLPVSSPHKSNPVLSPISPKKNLLPDRSQGSLVPLSRYGSTRSLLLFVFCGRLQLYRRSILSCIVVSIRSAGVGIIFVDRKFLLIRLWFSRLPIFEARLMVYSVHPSRCSWSQIFLLFPRIPDLCSAQVPMVCSIA